MQRARKRRTPDPQLLLLPLPRAGVGRKERPVNLKVAGQGVESVAKGLGVAGRGLRGGKTGHQLRAERLNWGGVEWEQTERKGGLGGAGPPLRRRREDGAMEEGC